LKRIDRYLVNETIITKIDRVRSWVRIEGGLDHSPIFLQMEIPRIAWFRRKFGSGMEWLHT
jgi:hypothetical protein